jgi:hypothetical protein
LVSLFPSLSSFFCTDWCCWYQCWWCWVLGARCWVLGAGCCDCWVLGLLGAGCWVLLVSVLLVQGAGVFW